MSKWLSYSGEARYKLSFAILGARWRRWLCTGDREVVNQAKGNHDNIRLMYSFKVERSFLNR